jgi:hypothetical protein
VGPPPPPWSIEPDGGRGRPQACMIWTVRRSAPGKSRRPPRRRRRSLSLCAAHLEQPLGCRDPDREGMRESVAGRRAEGAPASHLTLIDRDLPALPATAHRAGHRDVEQHGPAAAFEHGLIGEAHRHTGPDPKERRIPDLLCPAHPDNQERAHVCLPRLERASKRRHGDLNDFGRRVQRGVNDACPDACGWTALTRASSTVAFRSHRGLGGVGVRGRHL